MSHPLFFRGITYFYPIGNTSAVRLTEHLPPEQHANILLLACGDPRHILYTLYTNETSSDVEPQKLDITCCDIEPAVLARNALLFALLADEGSQDRLDLVWNIFYHFMVDQESLFLLVEKCHELVILGKDLESWNAGPYARFLTVCDTRTLAELHRIWSLYVATATYSPDQSKWWKKNFLDGVKEVNDKFGDGFVLSSSRSAGPLLPLATRVFAEQFRKFWTTGITDDGLHSIEQATFVNPTFAFSASKETFAVHYGTDPVAGFHFAELFAHSHEETPTLLQQKLVRAARNQFSQWCTSAIRLLRITTTSLKLLVVRMFAGDALMLCHAFSHLNSCGATDTFIPTSPWKASRIEFDEKQYGAGVTTPAPTTFNVIDTSNVSDHVGFLNLLVAIVPILSKSPSAMLYTESLLSYGDAPSTGILERLCGDIQTMALLLGIIPSTFLSRFTTRSNVHESLLQGFNSMGTQYHERVAWKAIDSKHSLSFTPNQLAPLLFEVYSKMFSDEDMARQMQNLSLSSNRAVLEQTLVHYTRQSFVQLLSHIKSRIETDWGLVMGLFDDRVVANRSLVLNSNFYQEMCCHFHLLDVVTFTSMEPAYIRDLQVQTQSTIFAEWETVPPVVTVVLVVPRNRILAIEPDLRRAGTPVLLCEIRNSSLWNMFAHISASYGRFETTGTGQMKTAIIAEEKEGESSCPLIVSFSVPSSTLMLSPKATVGFRTRPSPRSLSRSLLETIFDAPLDDPRRVHILAKPPLPSLSRSDAKHSSKQVLGESKLTIAAQMNASCAEVRSFTIRVDITDPAGQASLAAGSTVKIKSGPAHGASLCIDEYKETIYFPLPVDVANTKLRIARKSMYVELIATLAMSMLVRSEADVTKRFTTVLDSKVPALWHVHRVNLDRCPPFKPSELTGTSKWLVPHVSLMFSHRERAVRDMESPTVKDTFMNMKDSLHSLLLFAAGVQGPVRSVFALQNTTTGQILAVIFVADLRLDLGSHTVIADAWVAPATRSIRDKLQSLEVQGGVVTVAIKLDAEESEAWRYLLPLLVERCRTWRHKPGCEYVTHGALPLYPGAGVDPEKGPFCSCGVGVGTGTLPTRFQPLAAYVTRVAISPLFAISYLEKVGMTLDASTVEQDRGLGCRSCGKKEGPLSLCAKCKGVKYCSKGCQVKDWKVHKKNCVR